MPWLLWWGMVKLVQRGAGSSDHPLVENRPLVRTRRALFWLMVVVFVGVFMPVPIRPMMVGPQAPAADPPISASLAP